jgi:hypothetical protein
LWRRSVDRRMQTLMGAVSIGRGDCRTDPHQHSYK